MIVIIMAIGGIALYILISGIVLYCKTPKPPNNGTYSDYYDYYNRAYNHIETVPDAETETEKLRISKDIDFYTAQIAMLEDLERLIEKDLHNGSGNEKTNLSRLISIDKQIHITQKKVEKLQSDLKSLD